MNQITAYRCEHCKKVFLKSNRHICRKKPEYRNCYTCEHWGHQFRFDKTLDGSWEETCDAEAACKIESDHAHDAYEIMRGRGWRLNCSDWKGI
jgi:hypothetical protein